MLKRVDSNLATVKVRRFMLKRLYVNGYRCLVGFEYRPGNLDLLVGRPGSGRSSVKDILISLGSFLRPWRDKAPLCDSFWTSTHTRWLTGNMQTFEVEVEHEKHSFLYRVELVFTGDGNSAVLASEQLCCDGQLLFSLTQDPQRPHVNTSDYDHDDEDDPVPPSLQALAGNRRYLGEELADTNDARLRLFRDWWQNALCPLDVGIDDYLDREGENPSPGRCLYDFSPWCRYMMRAAPERMEALNRELAEVFDGYVRLKPSSDDNLDPYEDGHVAALFDNPTGDEPVAIPLSALAKEQLVLVQLYAITHLGLEPGRTVIIDAPDAAIPRTDLRRWLQGLIRHSQDIPMQLIVIVNEPDILDDLPGGTVQRFERERGGPTVIPGR